MNNSQVSGYRNPEARFWRRVDRNGPIHSTLGACWVWTGGKFDNSYGAIYVDGKSKKAHHFSWTYHYGPFSSALCVLHKCDNPSCVNPHHLFLGSKADNSTDMVRKGRQTKGEQHSRAKVTEEMVKVIRSEYVWRSSTHGTYGLAKKYGLSQYCIMSIIQRKTWKHVS